MRIVLAAPPAAADAPVKRLLAAACGVEWQTAGEGPADTDTAAVAEWVERGGFREDSALHRFFPYERALADLLAGIPVRLVTVVRNPYDLFLAVYRSVQGDLADLGQPYRRPIDVMAGKPLADPAVLAYLEERFRPYLARMAGWLADDRVTVLRYEDLRRDPTSTVAAAFGPLAPAAAERLARVVDSLTDFREPPERSDSASKSAGTRSASFTAAHLSVFRARHADLIERLGYEVVRPGPGTPKRLPSEGGDGALWPLDSIRWGNAVPGGRQHFVELGRAFARDVIERCALLPEERVLEVGCGGGRVAIALADYLAASGSYDGFDIDRETIQWCEERITSRFPNFRFRWADLYSAHYNPTATVKAEEYRFPYPDASFDVCFLASVFTHMLPRDVAHYLHEIARVLRPGGRCLMSLFLLNAETRELLRQGRCRRPFPHDRGVYRLEREDIPEAAVAYDEGYLRQMVEAAGLAIPTPIVYAPWCGRHGAPPGPGQDLLVAVRRA